MPYHVLLVEDHEAVRLLFARCLTQEGYQVTHVSDSETAIVLLTQETFHLLLTDYRLPGLMGDGLIRHVQEQYPAIRTILMSGDPATSYLARACGADGCYEKGTPLPKLMDSITGLLTSPVA